MTHPHRHEVFLRPVPQPGGGWAIECSVDCDCDWRPIPLHPSTLLPVDDATRNDLATYKDLIERFSRLEELEDLKTALKRSDQLAIGRHLYFTLFGDRFSLDKQWIHIVPTLPADEDDARQTSDFLDFVLRVPWLLMSNSRLRSTAQFLAIRRQDPVAITVDGAPELRTSLNGDVRLPRHPHILLIIPEREADPDHPTHGKQHLENLKASLAQVYNQDHLSLALRVAKTDEEIETAFSQEDGFNPHIIYYYGHAMVIDSSTYLFLDKNVHEPQFSLSRLETLAVELVNRTGIRPVFWMNGCQTGAAERGSAIRMLSPFASVVIATRTLAAVDDARPLGEQALPLMASGHAPPIALRDIIASQNSVTVNSARWATPITAVQYDKWTALGDSPIAELGVESLGDVPRRLDRHKHSNDIVSQLRDAIQQRSRSPDIVLWRGPPKQGVAIFGNRFLDLISEQFESWSPICRKVELAFDTMSACNTDQSLNRYFQVCLHNAIARPEDRTSSETARILPKRLRDSLMSLLGPDQTMVIFDHGTFDRNQRELLEKYIHFWRGQYSLLDVDPLQCRLVIGIGLQDETPFEGNDIVERVLDPVGAHDVIDHVTKYNRVAYGLTNPEQEALNIATQKGSRFEDLYEALQQQILKGETEL
jgi:hypothetical protein